MAIIWQKQTKTTNYEVRTAGNSIRLYSNGIFHSQYNPKRPFCGQLWDLLALPSLFVESDKPRQILVLGVGGGAVIKQLQQLLHYPVITGIELDTIHLHIAKEFFAVGNEVKLIHADAKEWLQHYQGAKFDLIIDDLFADQDGEPVRAVKATDKWMALLNKHLSSNGILVSNFVSRQELVQCAVMHNKRLWQQYQSIYQLSTPLTENRIGIFLRQASDSQQWRERIKSHESIRLRELRYTLRKIK